MSASSSAYGLGSDTGEYGRRHRVTICRTAPIRSVLGGSSFARPAIRLLHYITRLIPLCVSQLATRGWQPLRLGYGINL